MREPWRGMGALFSRLYAFFGPIFLGVWAGGSIAILGTKAVFLVPVLAGALVAFHTPYSPLYTVLATVPINVEIVGPITVSRLAIVFGIFVAYWQGVKNQAPFPRLAIYPEGTLGLAFFLWILFASVAVGGGDFLSRVGPHIVYSAIFFVVLNYVDTLGRMRAVMVLIIGVAMAQGVLVLAEAMFNVVPFGGWQAQLAEERGSEEVRVVGASSHPIILAGFFQVAFGFALMLLLTARRAVWRMALLGASGLFLVAWWYTFARSSWIGMAVMLVVAMVLASRPTRIMALSGGMVVFLLLWAHDFSPRALIDAVENLAAVRSASSSAGVAEGSESLGWRTENWAAAVSIWAENPLVGIGLDRSTLHVLEHLPRGAVAHQYIPPAVPHNMFLLLLAEAGLPAFLLFNLLWITAFAAAIRAWIFPDMQPYALALIAVMCGQIATFFFNPMPREVWLTMGLSMALGRLARKRRASLRPPSSTQRGVGSARA
jgi:O-antigen ligase